LYLMYCEFFSFHNMYICTPQMQQFLAAHMCYCGLWRHHIFHRWGRPGHILKGGGYVYMEESLLQQLYVLYYNVMEPGFKNACVIYLRPRATVSTRSTWLAVAIVAWVSKQQNFVLGQTKRTIYCLVASSSLQ
jgi:hypothetical protein